MILQRCICASKKFTREFLFLLIVVLLFREYNKRKSIPRLNTLIEPEFNPCLKYFGC